MKRGSRRNRITLNAKTGGSHITLLVILLLLNLALMATSVSSRRNVSNSPSASSQIHPAVEPRPIRERREDGRWAGLILTPLRRLYLLIGLVPLALIAIAAGKDRVRNPLTWVSYGVVLIILTITLAIASYSSDLAGLSVLTDQAYLRFSRQNDFLRSLLMWLSGSMSVGLVLLGLTFRSRQDA